jgi:hypothetical protein
MAESTWVKAVPPAAVVAWAKRRSDAMLRQHGHGLFVGDASLAAIGEAAVAAWGRRIGLNSSLNGGYDGKPDVVVGGVGLGVKTVCPERRYFNDPFCIVPDSHLDKEWPFWMFVAVCKEAPHEISILGAMTPRAFRDQSRPENWKYPCHVINATSGILITPRELAGILHRG